MPSPHAGCHASASPVHNALLDRARQYARKDVLLLLEGESGTGKTLLARQLHEWSHRAPHPFHAISLAAVEDSLAGTELFGHTRGAFTNANASRPGAFVTANRGTLFLDEIGKASRTVQYKLLTVIEDRIVQPLGSDQQIPVDVRIIAATNVPLEQLCSQGNLLPDLLSRLRAFVLRLPPLRERREDIPSLVYGMIAKHAPALGGARKTLPAVDPLLLRALTRAEWPLNLRELDATVQRLLVEAGDAETLTLDHCQYELAPLRGLVRRARQVSVEQVRTTAEHSASRAATARKLGVSEATVYRRLRKDADRPTHPDSDPQPD